MDDKCLKRFGDFEARKNKYEGDKCRELIIKPGHILHRLIREGEVEDGKPKRRIFTDRSLSVLVEGDGFPELKVSEVIKEINKALPPEKPKFIGAYKIEQALFPSGEYQTRHDPFPGPGGESQHPNHAQVFCNKPGSKARETRDEGDWTSEPN